MSRHSFTHIGRSRPEYPKGFLNVSKFWIWQVAAPFHPVVRDVGTWLGVISHSGRQPFLLGKLHGTHLVEEFVTHLTKVGFGRHTIAWRDTDELLSLRRTDGFSHQYHVRIFADGEVRGHYEYTPEAYPILHLLQIGMERRSEQFHVFLKDAAHHFYHPGQPLL